MVCRVIPCLLDLSHFPHVGPPPSFTFTYQSMMSNFVSFHLLKFWIILMTLKPLNHIFCFPAVDKLHNFIFLVFRLLKFFINSRSKWFSSWPLSMFDFIQSWCCIINAFKILRSFQKLLELFLLWHIYKVHALYYLFNHEISFWFNYWIKAMTFKEEICKNHFISKTIFKVALLLVKECYLAKGLLLITV